VLAELFHWLATPCPPVARKLGYRREAIATWRRYRRREQAWQPHLKATHDIIRRAIAIPDRHRAAIVLGSGALLDIPLDDLATAFERVELLDLVHPRPARRTAREFDNVEIRTADLAGITEKLATSPPTEIPVPAREDLPAIAADADLVVSANLLAQLPVLPRAYLAARHAHSKTVLDKFAAELVRMHLDWLFGLDAVVCLVTETHRFYRDSGGEEVGEWDALFGGNPGLAGTGWTWPIGAMGESAPGLAACNHVVGIPDLRTMRRNAAPNAD